MVLPPCLRPRTVTLALLVSLNCASARAAEAPAPANGSPPPVTTVPPASCPGNPDALGTARTLVVDPATTPPVGLKTYPHSLGLADHEVALTFDDGPSPVTTPRVLAALEHDCVRATFFLIGRNARAAPALVRREIADGDTVGHHTWSHPLATERSLPDAAARADIDHGFAADDQAAYGTSTGAPRTPFFRFPGFGDSPALLAWLEQRHVVVFSADLWASDWIKQTPEAELALLMGRLEAAGRGIILLHDIKQQTADMLPLLLHTLKAKGYRVVALAPGPGPTPLRDAPPGWTSDTEKAVAEAVTRERIHLAAAIRAKAARRAAPSPITLKSLAPSRADTPKAPAPLGEPLP